MQKLCADLKSLKTHILCVSSEGSVSLLFKAVGKFPLAENDLEAETIHRF